MHDELAYAILNLRDKLNAMSMLEGDIPLLKALENEVDSVQTMIDFLKADIAGDSL